MSHIRVLIVESAPTSRDLLQRLVDNDPQLIVIGAVASGEQALGLLVEETPDVISMDIHLPGKSGFEVTREIMAIRPTPIVLMASGAEVADPEITAKALKAGAVAIVEKPADPNRLACENAAVRLCSQLALMSQVKVIKQRRLRHKYREVYTLLGIGASTGGPKALPLLLNDLGPDFNLPIALVQHIQPGFLESFATWLAQVTPFSTRIVYNREEPKPGWIYLAPADRHLLMDKGQLRINSGKAVSRQRPSCTVLFESMAHALGKTAIGVQLTGMGDDGASGLLALRHAGAYTIAEEETTAVVYSMPKAAIELGAVCEICALPRIAPRLAELASPQGRIPGH